MAIFSLRGCGIPLRTTWHKWGSFVVHLYQKDSKSVKKWLSYGHFPPCEVVWFHWEPHGTKGEPLVFICTKKIQNRSRNGWILSIFPLRLLDSIYSQMVQKGIFWCSFVPKRSKIGQKRTELWPFPPCEVTWFIWDGSRMVERGILTVAKGSEVIGAKFKRGEVGWGETAFSRWPHWAKGHRGDGQMWRGAKGARANWARAKEARGQGGDGQKRRGFKGAMGI